MPASVPFFVLLVDAFGCAYEWAEFWAPDVRAARALACEILQPDGVAYIRVVRL